MATNIIAGAYSSTSEPGQQTPAKIPVRDDSSCASCYSSYLGYRTLEAWIRSTSGRKGRLVAAAVEAVARDGQTCFHLSIQQRDVYGVIHWYRAWLGADAAREQALPEVSDFSRSLCRADDLLEIVTSYLRRQGYPEIYPALYAAPPDIQILDARPPHCAEFNVDRGMWMPRRND